MNDSRDLKKERVMEEKSIKCIFFSKKTIKLQGLINIYVYIYMHTFTTNRLSSKNKTKLYAQMNVV